jgi:hypothetical protein
MKLLTTKKYFQIATTLGYGCAMILASVLLGGTFTRLMTPQNLFAVVVGFASSFWLARCFDRNSMESVSFKKTMTSAVKILNVGVWCGCAVNLFLNGSPWSPKNGLTDELWSWFIKPGLWVGVAGIPACLILALIYNITFEKMAD